MSLTPISSINSHVARFRCSWFHRINNSANDSLDSSANDSLDSSVNDSAGSSVNDSADSSVNDSAGSSVNDSASSGANPSANDRASGSAKASTHTTTSCHFTVKSDGSMVDEGPTRARSLAADVRRAG